MWRCKDSENIIYLDRQKGLMVKPTIFADNRMLPFRDGVFDIVIFDPPHFWRKSGKYAAYTIPDISMVEDGRKIMGHTYYGVEQYKTKTELVKYVYDAQKELRRVLKDDGILLFKWCEIAIPLDKILVVFNGWRELMRIPVKSPLQTLGKRQTWWVMMEKKQTADLGSYGGGNIPIYSLNDNASQACEEQPPSQLGRQAR